MFFGFQKVRAFIFILLLIFCTGCGNKQVNMPSPSLKLTETPIPTSAVTVTPNIPTPRLVDIPGLLHIAARGGCSDHMILAADRLTYDSGEIQQMVDYFTTVYKTGSNPSLPSILAIAQGSFIGTINSWNYKVVDCERWLEITNISQGPIQITQVRLKLGVDTQPNKQHYRLINICPYLFQNGFYCLPGQGGPLVENYVFHLGPASKGAVFRDLKGSNRPTLQPGETLETNLVLTPRDASGYLIYSLVPELLLNTSSTVGQIFDLPELTETIAFAALDQFSCYQLQGDTFVPIAPGPTLPIVDGNATVTCS